MNSQADFILKRQGNYNNYLMQDFFFTNDTMSENSNFELLSSSLDFTSFNINFDQSMTQELSLEVEEIIRGSLPNNDGKF